VKNRFVSALFVLLSVFVVGTAGYMLIEGWGLLDSIYMTVITIATVGYGEVADLSAAGRIFTIFLILTGVGTIAFAFGRFVDMVVEGRLQGLWEGRRMQKRIDDFKDHHIVAGIGRVGAEVCRGLEEEGVDFVVIDRSPECVAIAKGNGWAIIEGDASEETTLIRAGIERARSLVTALDTDADNLFVTLTARQLGPDLFIVSRSSHASSEEKLLKAGANRVITPNVIGGRRMASMVLHPVVSGYLDLVSQGAGIEFRLEELVVGLRSALVGQTLAQAQIREKTGALILAVYRDDGTVDANPPSGTMILGHDTLVTLGTQEQLEALACFTEAV